MRQPRIVIVGHLQAAVLAVALDYLVVSEHTAFVTAFIPQARSLSQVATARCHRSLPPLPSPSTHTLLLTTSLETT